MGRGNGSRKPPKRVLSINGNLPERDLVTDTDYQKAIDAQDAELFAEANTRKILGTIRRRLQEGATDGGRKYYFDEERGIVRRRMNQETGS